MIIKAKRYFNTSGPNIPMEHYTLKREELIEKGLDLVQKKRYFTIWAPRQSGKSTYFRMLAKKIGTMGYMVLHTNLENFQNASEQVFLEFLGNEFKRKLDIRISTTSPTFPWFYDQLLEIKDRKIVLIIDEIEGLNEKIFGQFLHTLRNLYHSRDEHCIKSLLLVGVSNIIGVVQDNASPFNITDNLEVPYFTDAETHKLLHMHEEETGQWFDNQVKEKIAAITGNQPGLVNGFAYRLVEQNPAKPVIGYEDYLKVEHWYIKIAVDKNIANIINKAKQYRKFVERLLFDEKPLKFSINDERVKFLAAYGVIKDDAEGFINFNVPLYKKAMFDAFYPYANGEEERFFSTVDFKTLFYKEGKINFKVLIDNYKAYIKRRGFKYFREKDEKTGEYKSLKEAALAYSFETYIQSFLLEVGGKSYLEPHTGLGRSDLIININGHEYVIEFKIYRSPARFEKGKVQLAYYAESIAVPEGIYLVFVPNTVKMAGIKEGIEEMGKTLIKTFIVYYDEEKDF
jgi:hypothetical protein